MTSTAYVFVIGLPIAALLGPLLVRAGTGPRARLAVVPARLTERFGRGPGLVASAAAAGAAFVLVGLVLGELVKLLTSPIDDPALRWQKAQYDLSKGFFHLDWYHWNTSLTKMGNTVPSRELVVVASVLLAALWWRRRFWIPPVVIAGTYLTAWASQHVFVSIVARTPPNVPLAPTLGTWPSGGCMRIVSVWGIIALLLVRSFPRAPRWFGTVLAVFVAVAAWTEAYTRIYLVKHWVTDAIGGLVMGVVLLLLSAVVTTAWIDRPVDDPEAQSRRAEPATV